MHPSTGPAAGFPRFHSQFSHVIHPRTRRNIQEVNLTPSVSSTRLVSLVCACVCTLTPATIDAQSSGQHVSTLTFNAAVQVPGAILPAGTYMFRQIAGQIDRHGLVQVSAVGQSRLVAQFPTTPTRRPTTGEDVTFRSTPNSTPPAIGMWYFDKGMDGSEFLYSASELRALANPPARRVNPNR